jgi:hypothetical protein
MVRIATIRPAGIPDQHRSRGVRDLHLSARKDLGSRQGPSERSPTQPAAGRHAAPSTFLRHRYLYLPVHVPRTLLHAVTLPWAQDENEAVNPNSSGNEGLAKLEERDQRAHSSPPTPRQTHHGSTLRRLDGGGPGRNPGLRPAAWSLRPMGDQGPLGFSLPDQAHNSSGAEGRHRQSRGHHPAASGPSSTRSSSLGGQPSRGLHSQRHGQTVPGSHVRTAGPSLVFASLGIQIQAHYLPSAVNRFADRLSHIKTRR